MKMNVVKLISILLTALFWIGVFFSVVITAVDVFAILNPDLLQSAYSNYHVAVGSFNFTYKDENLLRSDIMIAPFFFILYTFLFWYFRRIFKNLAKGQIFVTANATSIMVIGILLLIHSLTNSIPDLMVAEQLLPMVNIENGQVDASYTVSTSLCIASLLIILLGVFFHKAVRIANENELTI